MEQEMGIEFTKIKGKYYMSSEVDAYVVTLRSYYKEMGREIEGLEEKIKWLEETRAQEHIKMDESLADGEKELQSAKSEQNSLQEELNQTQEELKGTQEELKSTQEELKSTQEKLRVALEKMSVVEKELCVVQEELNQAQMMETTQEEGVSDLKEEKVEIDISGYRSEKYLSIIDSAVQMADAYVENVEKKMDELLQETEVATTEKLDQARHQSFDIIREANRKAELMESKSQATVNQLLEDARKEYAEIRALIEKASLEYAQITTNNNFIF